MNKIWDDAYKCIEDITDGSTIMVGGFGLCGVPQTLINALLEKNSRNLTFISNNCGTNEHGLSLLLKNGQVKKMISSYVGENKIFESQFLEGKIELELIPQGTFAEKIRSYGAGIPAFFTPTGVGTFVSEGGLPMKYDASGNVIKYSEKKEVRNFNGKEYVLEKSLGADFAFIKAHKVDPFGNLVFRKTARNFNPVMCTAAKIAIVEAEEIVDLGELKADEIHLSGVYVKRIIKTKIKEKLIEFVTTKEQA